MSSYQVLPKSSKDRIKGEIYLFEDKPRRWSGSRLEKVCEVCHNKRPSFCLENETLATHCVNCKTDEMVDINNINKNCSVCKTKQASFGLNGKKSHCKDCKTEEMVNNKYKGNKKCFCGLHQPKFNYPNTLPATHCSKCKLTDMVNVYKK